MKCPKCSYIGFEPSDRCRNCGFDFSLSSAAPGPGVEPDLPMRSSEPMGPMADFDLGESRRPPGGTPQGRTPRRRQDATPDPGFGPPALTPSDLPLFGDLPPDDVPLVRPAAPSAPLSVRRSTPAPTRLRAPVTPRPPEPRAADAVLPLDTALGPSAGSAPTPESASAAGETAGLGLRAGAAAVDWLMLLGLDVTVVYFTLRVSRVAAGDILTLPLAPLVAFLVLLNGGYLVLFTAGSGQTLGKMALGLKVVSGSDAPLTVGRALLRETALLVGTAAAGLGLLPAAFDGARRGLHDRLADTRVVHAS